MKTNIKQVLIFSIVIVLLCFLIVFLFTLPSFINQFTLSSEGRSYIGSAIGGITAPVIGIASSILLYLALSKQTESNIDQRLKNESDVIFLLLNQLDIEISNFNYNTFKGIGDNKVETISIGRKGLNEFSNNAFNRYRTFSNQNLTFKESNQSKQILMIIRSFSLIEKRIELASLSAELKTMFLQKLESIFECILEDSLSKIIKSINEFPQVQDQLSEELNVFLIKNKKKPSIS